MSENIDEFVVKSTNKEGGAFKVPDFLPGDTMYSGKIIELRKLDDVQTQYGPKDKLIITIEVTEGDCKGKTIDKWETFYPTIGPKTNLRKTLNIVLNRDVGEESVNIRKELIGKSVKFLTGNEFDKTIKDENGNDKLIKVCYVDKFLKNTEASASSSLKETKKPVTKKKGPVIIDGISEKVLRGIGRFCDVDPENVAELKRVYQFFEMEHLDKIKVDTAIEQLKKEGLVLEPKTGYISTVETAT